jgi:predicted RNA-binding Zn ribbon-like protein
VLFAHDTEQSLLFAAALVNTGRGGQDALTDQAALDELMSPWEWTGIRDRDENELALVRALRARIEAMWVMGKDDAAAFVNALLAESRALPQLVKHGTWDYHLHATSPEAPLAERMAAEEAMAFADVIRAGELDRLRMCAADHCDNVLVDLSKNRSRRFCSTACANRVNVAAYRARRAAR